MLAARVFLGNDAVFAEKGVGDELVAETDSEEFHVGVVGECVTDEGLDGEDPGCGVVGCCEAAADEDGVDLGWVGEFTFLSVEGGVGYWMHGGA